MKVLKGKRIMILARTGMILPLLAMFFSSCKEKGILDWSDPEAGPKEGKLLRVGYEDENYPLTYYLPTGEVVGYGVTILNLFAQEYGYRLEYRSGTWDSNVLSLQHKKIDCIMDYFSSSFTEMMESTGEFKRTPSVLEYYMVYLVRNAEAVE